MAFNPIRTKKSVYEGDQSQEIQQEGDFSFKELESSEDNESNPFENTVNENYFEDSSSQEEISETEKNEKIEFIQPKRSAKKDSMNDPYKAELDQRDAYKYTLKTLNALKIVSPVISALMQRPGIDAINSDISQGFTEIIAEISQISEKVCEKLSIDSTKEKNYWIRNVLERSFSEVLHDQWIANGKSNISDIIYLVDAVVEYSEKTSEESHYDDVPAESFLKIAGIKSMLPVINEANEFNLYRNIELDIEPIMTKLFEASKEAVKKLSHDYANENDKAKLFYMIMQEAGTLYASSWKHEAKRIKEIIQINSEEKVKEVIEKHKKNGGLPLDKINNDFNKYFNRMVAISEKLVLSQKGNISNRLKT